MELSLIFAPLNPLFFPRENDGGWDVSAYLSAARGPCADYDAMLCLGESNYFHRQGWLDRLAQAWSRHGPGMYGPFSSNVVMAHLNTTAFFTAPLFLRQYIKRVVTRADRYEFEHQQGALWRRVSAKGYPVRLVTWDGEWEPRFWRSPRNILWKGDQSNCLMWCNHSDGYTAANPHTRANWERQTNAAFK